MIPRLGDGNGNSGQIEDAPETSGLENDSPSRGRKHPSFQLVPEELQ